MLRLRLQAATQGDETAETVNRARHVNGGSTGDQSQGVRPIATSVVSTSAMVKLAW